MNSFLVAFLLTSVAGILASYLASYLSRFAPNTSIDYSEAEHRLFQKPNLARVVACFAITGLLSLVLQFIALIYAPPLYFFFWSIGLMIVCLAGIIIGGRTLKCAACGESVSFLWNREPKHHKKAKWGLGGPGGIYFDIIVKKRFNCCCCGQPYVLGKSSDYRARNVAG